MDHRIAESAWKDFRALREEALRRLCERALGEVGAALDAPSRSEHERFLDVFAIVTDRNEHIARAFDDPRRSRLLIHLAAMRDLGLLSPDLVSRAGPELRELILRVQSHNRR
jgi:hypothetical protein